LIQDFDLSDEELRDRFYTLETRADVADALGVSLQFLTAVLYRDGVDQYYISWQIKKKSGGTRTIMAPQRHVFFLQQRVNRLLQAVYRPKASTQGFVHGRSVVTNAAPHVGKRFVLNVDLVDFFPSINFGRVRGVLMAKPFGRPGEVATLLATLCCVNNGLPIGAPTSPVLANMVCMRLDVELQRLARRHHVWYTRYADDLSFSTNRRPFPDALGMADSSGSKKVGDELRSVIEGNGFRVNEAKVRLHGPFDRHSVTGLVVNQRLNVDRRYIRNIRAMLHNWDRDGEDAVQQRFGTLDTADRRPGSEPLFTRVLQGKIAYLAMVRGDDDPLVERYRAQFRNLKEGRPRNDGLESPAPVVAGDREVTVLHLSDFHFQASTAWDSNIMLEGLVEVLSKEGVSPDIVALTGDIAQSGGKDEYDRAASWISGSLLRRLGIEPEALFIVPGNHDVLRPKGSAIAALRQATRAASDPDAFLAQTLDDPDEMTMVGARFRNYSRFVTQVTTDPDRSALWWRKTVEVGDVSVAIAGLNSALLSYENDEQGKLWLGKYQVHNVIGGDADLKIALLHHPYSFFDSNDSQSHSSLDGWADVVLHGHLHSYQVSSISDGRTGVLRAGAGSAYQGTGHDNVCQVLKINVVDRSVTVTPIRWMPDQQWRVSRDFFPEGDGNFGLPPD
jgi:RNA-directed DNA polymerase